MASIRFWFPVALVLAVVLVYFSFLIIQDREQTKQELGQFIQQLEKERNAWDAERKEFKVATEKQKSEEKDEIIDQFGLLNKQIVQVEQNLKHAVEQAIEKDKDIVTQQLRSELAEKENMLRELTNKLNHIEKELEESKSSTPSNVPVDKMDIERVVQEYARAKGDFYQWWQEKTGNKLYMLTYSTRNFYPHFCYSLASAAVQGLDLNVLGWDDAIQEHEAVNKNKIKAMNNFITQGGISDDDIIFFIDGWDSLYMGGASELLEKYLSFNTRKVVFGAELGLFPDMWKDSFPEPPSSPLYPNSENPGQRHKHLNSGVYVGFKSTLATVYQKYFEEVSPNHQNDQVTFHLLWSLYKDELMALDYFQQISYLTFSSPPESFHYVTGPEYPVNALVSGMFSSRDEMRLVHALNHAYGLHSKQTVKPVNAQMASTQGRSLLRVRVKETGAVPFSVHFNGHKWEDNGNARLESLRGDWWNSLREEDKRRVRDYRFATFNSNADPESKMLVGLTEVCASTLGI